MSHLGPIRREFRKLLAQKRTYFGAAGLVLVPIIFSIGLYLSSHDQGGAQGGGDQAVFLIRTFSNGLYVPAAALFGMSVFLLPLAAAMVGGFMLAGEAEQGTMRTMLVRPVRRGAVVMAKWATAMLYLAAVLALVLIAGLLSGWLFFGLKPMLILGGVVSVWHGIWLNLLAYLVALAFISCVVSLAMLFSSFLDSSLTSAVIPMVIVLVVQIVLQFSYFKVLRPYWFMNHFDAWEALFKTPVPLAPLRSGLIAYAAWSTGATVLAWLFFRRRDILS
jgi:ABC-2 type transport system permease protein